MNCLGLGGIVIANNNMLRKAIIFDIDIFKLESYDLMANSVAKSTLLIDSRA